MAISYDELNKECEFWRQVYHISGVNNIAVSKESARIIWIALTAAKARNHTNLDPEIQEISNKDLSSTS